MEGFYGTGIRSERAARRYLRRKFNEGGTTPVQPKAGHRFYVTARRGTGAAFLAGPYGSHLSALSAVASVRDLAREKHPGLFAFASFGTASAPVSVGTSLGRVRAY